MTSPPLTSENLTLFDTSKLILAELQTTNRLLIKLIEGQRNQADQFNDLNYLVNGFTSGGASFNAYQVDQMTLAYLALMGPLLAQRMDMGAADINELIKGGTLLARQLVDELGAYRSQQGSFDYLEEQAELINDPWQKEQQQQGES
ncbi:MAG: hypothetical protein EBZ24_13880 [Synechococcaceae bacterium WB9_4xB_025]|nr:hypothetical protein [Synechococcaceae bacterium WB9_4xB_025]